MLLAMDTTLAACSVALADGDTLLGHQKQVMERGQAEALLPMVEDVVRAAGREMADITRIAVTSGPGSFTGVRLAVAAARGLSLALKCPVAAVTTLELIAATAVIDNSIADGQPVAALLDAKRGQVFGQLFKAQSMGFPVTPLEDAASYEPTFPSHWVQSSPMLYGDGCHLIKEGHANTPLPDACDLARLAPRLDDARWGYHPVPFYALQPSATPPSAPKIMVK